MTHVNGTNRPFRSASTFAFANLQSYLMALSTQVIQTILHTVHDMCNSGWSKRAQASLHHNLSLSKWVYRFEVGLTVEWIQCIEVTVEQ